MNDSNGQLVKISEVPLLPRFEAAKHALAEARTIDEVKDVRDQAEALRLYAKQAGESLEMQNAIAEIKLRAERRAGELLAAMDKHQGGNPNLSHNATGCPPALSELGIKRDQSSRWQREASLPKEVFERHIAEVKEQGKELTSAGMLLLAQREQRKQTWEARQQACRRLATDGLSEAHIVVGDCCRVPLNVEPRSVQLIFLDPPYNQGEDYGDGPEADGLADEIYLGQMRTCLERCAKLLAPDGSVWTVISWAYGPYFHIMQKDLRLTWRDTITWYETFGVNCTKKFNRCSRAILYFVKDPENFVFNAEAVNRPSDRQEKYGDKRANPYGKLWDNVWEIPRVTGTCKERVPGFPTQLPLALLRPIIGCATDPGDLVVDPFCGSGTTGAACIELGRRFIGIEKSEQFASAARARLAHCVNEVTNR
jgi:DNA modification methylase